MSMIAGQISRVSGPVVQAKGMEGIKIRDLVQVGQLGLMGEVIEIKGDLASIQVYEETDGLTVGEPVSSEGIPFLVELGPGLIGSIYDGIQRPLEVISEQTGAFIRRGTTADPLPRERRWPFEPTVAADAQVGPGDIIGTVQESSTVLHKIMVPEGVNGVIAEIKGGEYTIEEPIAQLEDGQELFLRQRCPIRRPRPYLEKIAASIPLVTGQRIFDVLFPVTKGGSAIIPGPFGSGKCIWGDGPVLLGDGTLVPIKELYETYCQQGRRIKDGYEEYTFLDEPLEVFSYQGQRVTKQLATVVYKGWTDSLIEVRTRTGRRARVTPVHKLLVADGDLSVREVQAQQLKPGDFLLTPRKIELESQPPELRSDFLATLEHARPCEAPVLQEVSALIAELAERYGNRQELAQRLEVARETLAGYAHQRNRPPLAFIRRLYALAGRALPEITQVKAEHEAHVFRIPEQMSPDLAEYLGLVLGDGTLKPRTVAFYNNDETLLARFEELSERLFGLPAKRGYCRTVACSLVHSKLLVAFLRSLGLPARQKSRRCSVPGKLFQADTRSLAHFAAAYFRCDGHVSAARGELELVTASQEMALGWSYLLLRLGLIAKLHEKRVQGRTYHRVGLSGRAQLQRFYLQCGDPRYAKDRQIQAYLDQEHRGYTAIDIVPASMKFLNAAYDQAGRPCARLERAGVYASNYLTAGERMSVATFQRFSEVVGLTDEANSPYEDIFFDEIIEVRRIEEPQAVYDLTVPETHNFIGGFGPMFLHNTVTQQTLAKWSDADIVIYVGCGERGNEMTEVLTEFPQLEDPRSGEPLMNRTILIANTSNMPVAARETSIYTGITFAEYYRDMGYDVALFADSTSRWAEALREISGRLEEIPGEEGYPPYLASRIASFYERSGRVRCLSSADQNGQQDQAREGSVTVIGAVSPPGGDFSEPVTQNSLRIAGTFWGLDAQLAYSRHFPAINWLTSYSLYLDALKSWYDQKLSEEFLQMRAELLEILQREDELAKTVQLVGRESLSDPDKLLLQIARTIRDDFLRQSAFHEIEAYCPLQKQFYMMKAILSFYQHCQGLLGKRPYAEIEARPGWEQLARMRYFENENFSPKYEQLLKELVADGGAVQQGVS